MRRTMLVALLAAAPLLALGSTPAEAYGYGGCRGYGYAPYYYYRPSYGYAYAPYYRPRAYYGSYFYRPRAWGWGGYGYRGWGGYGYRGGADTATAVGARGGRRSGRGRRMAPVVAAGFGLRPHRLKASDA